MKKKKKKAIEDRSSYEWRSRNAHRVPLPLLLQTNDEGYKAVDQFLISFYDCHVCQFSCLFALMI